MCVLEHLLRLQLEVLRMTAALVTELIYVYKILTLSILTILFALNDQVMVISYFSYLSAASAYNDLSFTLLL